MPELIKDTEPDLGRHNKDLPKTVNRLIEGYSWKKNDTILVIPASKTIPSRVVLSWMSLAFPPNSGVVRYMVTGEEVGEAYTRAFESIMADPNINNFEFILTLEHDNIPPPDGVLRLQKLLHDHPEFAALSGLYFTKGEMGVAQIWGDINDPVINYRPQVPNMDLEIQECYGIGMGFVLYRTSMFKDPQLKRPWFKTTATANSVGTQDLYFWRNARERGFRCGVATSVRVGHYDSRTEICW